MGVCLPPVPDDSFATDILTTDGYITKYQTKLTSLSIIDDAGCAWSYRLPCLDNFTDLRHLSWKGLRLGYKIQDLCHVFRFISHRLEPLELEIYTSCDVNQANWSYDPETRLRGPTNLMKAMLGCSVKTIPVAYPSLRYLSFSNADLRPSGRSSLDAIDFTLLRSLKIHDCLGVSKLLLQTPPDLQLDVLHITAGDQHKRRHHTILADFMSKVRGLKEVCLLIYPGMQSQYYWAALMGHTSTLNRLAYHERGAIPPELTPIIHQDFVDLSLFESKEGYPYFVPTYQIPSSAQIFVRLLDDSPLEFLALCDSPKRMVGLAPLLRVLRALNLLN